MKMYYHEQKIIFFLLRTANIGKGRNTKKHAGTKVTKT